MIIITINSLGFVVNTHHCIHMSENCVKNILDTKLVQFSFKFCSHDAWSNGFQNESNNTQQVVSHIYQYGFISHSQATTDQTAPVCNLPSRSKDGITPGSHGYCLGSKFMGLISLLPGPKTHAWFSLGWMVLVNLHQWSGPHLNQNFDTHRLSAILPGHSSVV